MYQFSSVTWSCPTLCDPMDYSMPGFPVHCQLTEFTQTHVHWLCDAIQPSHLLSSPSPPTFNLSQHQGLFQWVSSSQQVDKVFESSPSASVLPMNIQDWFLLRMDWLNLLAVQRTLKSLLQHHSSSISSLHTHTCKTICMMGRFSGWCQIGLWYQDSLSQAKFNPNFSSHQNLRHLQTFPTTWYLHTFWRSTLHLLVCLFSEQFSMENLSYYKITLPSFHWILNWQIKTKIEKWCNTKTVTGQLYQ